ncbi:hypothetical protein BXO88_14475 [Oribacterium sp. C9]|uniref:SGNH/GDSL hydrolase family protein n=1 Tax=Oribacterium sp. C9 TaxID=1943579 RepID=UPI00098EB56D|nr:SGNH/GDSL hydrolase family protein [Oribacterium sp. C9]OON84990.1 hypothetical protein BXO88_14475 [Oribacterium sp. C9]
MYRKKRIENISPFMKKLFGGTVCAIIFCGASFFVIRDYQEQKAYQAWALTENQELYNQSLSKRAEERLILKESQKKNDSFYQRLHDHLPVRILVLGDAYGQGLGAEKKSSAWFSILENSLRKKYKVNVTIDNQSLSKSGSAYSGFGLLSTLKNQSEGGKDYDLCILSFGTNETPKDFSLWYEGILQNLRTKYPHCSVMSILGHQGVMKPELGYLDDNADVLKSLTKIYHGTLIDMPEAMTQKNHEKSEDKSARYTNDGLFLNDSGQKLLADTIFHSIVSAVAKYPDYDKSAVTPVSPEIPALTNAVYIDSDNFKRIDQYTLTIGPSALKEAGIDTANFIGTLGVDFSYIPGANDLLVSDGGRGLGRNAFSLDGTKAERTIAPINDHVKISNYLMLSFLTKSQADTFKGVLFTKDVPMSESLDAFTSPETIGPVDETGALIPLDHEGMIMTELYAASTYSGTETSASDKPVSSKSSSAESKSENAVNETLVNSRPAESHSVESTGEEATSEKSTAQENASEESTAEKSSATENTSEENASESSQESNTSEAEGDHDLSQDQSSEDNGTTSSDASAESGGTSASGNSDTSKSSAAESKSEASSESEGSVPTLPDDVKYASNEKNLIPGEALQASSSPNGKNS